MPLSAELWSLLLVPQWSAQCIDYNITFKTWEQGVQSRLVRMKWSRNIFFQEWKKDNPFKLLFFIHIGSENQSDNPRSPWGFAKLICFSSTVSLQPTDHCLSVLRTAPPKRSHGNNCLCEMLKPSLFLGLSSIEFLFSRKSSHISPPYQNGSTAVLFVNFHQQRGCQALSGNLPCGW